MHGYHAAQIFVEAMKHSQGTPNQRAGNLAAAFMRAKGDNWVIDTPWMETT